MKAVFIQRDCLLRSSGYEIGDLPRDWVVAPEALSSMEPVQGDGLLSILIGTSQGRNHGHSGDRIDGELTRELAERIDAAGAPLDAVMTCPHSEGSECTCWGPEPGYLYEAARRLDLKLDECFLVADSPLDVELTYLTGCRPVFVLNGRGLAEVFGDQPKYKDFAIATDLPTAMKYVRDEEATAQQVGPREVSAPPLDLELMDSPEALPAFNALSQRVQALQPHPQRLRLQPREIGRWLMFFVAGGLGLSLGIGYLLADAYRERQFANWVWYATLQFIRRDIRGFLFILLGVITLVVAIRSFYHTYGNGARRRSPA